MRYSLIVLLSISPSFLAADTVTTTSALDAVKVFPQGALYNRTVSLDLSAGAHQVFVSGLPERLNVETLQARGSGMIIRALEFRTTRQIMAEQQKSDELVAAEQALDAARKVVANLANRRAKIEAQIASAKYRIEYLKSLADGKLAGSGTQASQSAEQLTEVVQVIGAQIATALVEQTEARNTLSETGRAMSEALGEVDRAKSRLDAVTPLERATGTAVIDLVAGNPVKGDMTLTYMSNDASWRPTYEVSVKQDGAKAKIDMVRLASVAQNSREDWQDVAVTLSTSDLNRRAEVYLPYPDIKYIYDPEVLRKLAKREMGQSLAVESMADMALPQASMEAAPAPEPYRVALRGQTLEFDLGNISSLQGDGATKLFRLDAVQSDVDLRAEATIGQNATAVLYAELENATGGTLLPGAVTLIRDDVLIGKASIPEVANGDTFDLALGPLNGILLEQRTLEVQDGDTGIISSYNQKIEKYEVTVRSLLDYPIDVTAYAALPVSEAEDLTVALETDPKPTEEDIEGRRGVVSWTLPMAAGSTQKISYGWKLKWPEDQLLGRR